MMKLLTIPSIIVALSVGTAFAQDVAAVDPAAGIPALEPVVAQCEIVAASPETGDPTDGICIGATQGYLGGLGSLSPAEKDQSIANLVLAIAPLVQDETCNEFDDEVAQAIRLAAAESSTPEQQAQLAEIAETITATCLDGTTAAIDDLLLDGGTQSPS